MYLERGASKLSQTKPFFFIEIFLTECKSDETFVKESFVRAIFVLYLEALFSGKSWKKVTLVFFREIERLIP